MGTVAFDGTRIDLADVSGSVWEEYDGGAVTVETDFVYSGSYCMAELVKTTEGGVKYYNATTSYDLSTTTRTMIYKTIATNYSSLEIAGSTAMQLHVGSGDKSAWHEYFVATDATYPITGGWLITPIDPNVSYYRDATTGSPSLTAVDYHAVVATFQQTAKSDNVGFDALDFIDNGDGLTITSTSGIFQDFIDFDEGTDTNRYGIISTKEGVLYVTGVLTIGTAISSAVFSDSNQTLVFPDGRFDTGFCGVDVDLSQAATTATLTSITMIGRGRRGYADFETTADVDGATEIITTNQTHNFETGDAATYSKAGGTAAIGLTDTTVYYINYITSTTIYVYDTKANAEAGTTTGRQNLTASGTETHTFTRTNDTRPDFTVTGTTGSTTIDACALNNFNAITLTYGATLSDSTLNTCQSLAQSQGTISGCTFNSSPVASNEAFMTVSDITDLSSSTFISGGAGHAIELDSTHAASPTEHTMSGLTFTSYGGTIGSNLVAASGDADAAIYNNSGKTLIINVTGGVTSPSVRNGAGATTTINNNIDVTITINNQSGNPIPGAEVSIFQDNTARTVVLASTATDESGEVATSAAASLGAIIIRVRQSTEIATFNTSATGVDGTGEDITTDSNHNFRDGDAVVYSKNSGTADVGLTEATTYYVNNIDSLKNLSLHTTAANAISDTSRVPLNTSGTETHQLDPIRYVANSATGTIGTSAFTAQITMVTDSIATG